MGGYRNSVTLGLVGLDIEAKAQLCEAVFWDAFPYGPEELDDVQITLSRTDHDDPLSNDAATARWTVTVKDQDSTKVGRPFSNAIFQTALASIPGMHGLSGGPKAADPFGVYQPAAVQRDVVPQYVHLLDGETTMVDSIEPSGETPDLDLLPSSEPVDGPTTEVPLGLLFGARSGDKGGNANLGVFARHADAWAWLDHFLTTERLRELLPETTGLAIDRYRLPRIQSLNFVIHDLLGEGVAASTRSDAQAKSLGEWLRARVVPIPRDLLPD